MAAYGKHFDSSEARHLALTSVASLRGNIRGPNAARFARTVGIGAATGVGSIIYSLCVLSEMLGNRDLIDDAFRACRLLTDDLVAADQQLDVFGGTAGAILGLMKLYSLTEEPEVLARAEHCATHLLKTARQGSPGARSWSGLEGTEPWAGFSHGAAGIAYSLMRLSTLAQNEDLETAANECLAYDALLYSESHDDWPTGMNSTAIVEGDDWNCQWCHGAGGIGLSRIGISRAKKGSDKGNTEIDSCVRAVLKAWPYPVDTLCCGNLGNVEFLREAASELNRPDLSNISTARLVGVLRAAATRGDYLWTNGNGKSNVGLFRGIAGVGYVSLRELSRNYPNILLWE